jgi:hypothetical protein
MPRGSQRGRDWERSSNGMEGHRGMRTEIIIHGAQPTLHRAGATIWLSFNLMTSTTEPSATLTLFFDRPDDVVALGQTLMAQAEMAKQLLILETDATKTAAS